MAKKKRALRTSKPTEVVEVKDDDFFSISSYKEMFKLTDDELINICHVVLQFNEDEYSLNDLVKEKQESMKGLLDVPGAIYLIIKDLDRNLEDLEGPLVGQARALDKFKSAGREPKKVQTPKQKVIEYQKKHSGDKEVIDRSPKKKKPNQFKRVVVSNDKEIKKVLEPQFKIISITTDCIKSIHFTPNEEQNGLIKTQVDYDHIANCHKCNQERLLAGATGGYCPVCDGVMTEQEYVEQLDIAFDHESEVVEVIAKDDLPQAKYTEDLEFKAELEDYTVKRVVDMLNWLYELMSDAMSFNDGYLIDPDIISNINEIKRVIMK